MQSMMGLLLGIFRDLYVVLLIIFIIEQIPGNDLLHDMTRKAVITVTIGVAVVKVVQPLFEGSAGPGRAPRRQKKTAIGKNSCMEWASSEMQGWRPAMEDAVCIVPSLPAPLSNQALFAVFDGHGGAQVSAIASEEFPAALAACAGRALAAKAKDADDCDSAKDTDDCDSFKETNSDSAEGEGGGDGAVAAKATAPEDGESAVLPTARLGESLHDALLAMDASLRSQGRNGVSTKSHAQVAMLGQPQADKKNAYSFVGSTAIIALIDLGDGAGPPRPRRVTVANCGDSRAVLCRKGKAVELSEDHKPESPGEEERIRKAGGHVAMIGPCHRIDGWGLNLSRALGDFHYKARSDLGPEEQKVIAVPEIRTLELTEDDEFLVLGCDGIFELHTSQKAIDIVREAYARGLSTEKAAEDLVDKSCSSNLMKTRGKGGDNCSAIVVKLR
mmetsp:Transcript_578/g.1619  ORF Transcript_578/g.1619 Transcript_578/m.1619 type:complete len:444 (-) Transcript_578:139-1470(-)